MKIPEIWVSAGESLLADGNIEKLLQYNIAGIRFNTGRGSYLWIREKIAQLINAGYPPNKILVDIGNKKPRITLTGRSREFSINKGDSFSIYNRQGMDNDICLLNESFFEAAEKGDIVYFGDGETECSVDAANDNEIRLHVRAGGILSNNAPIGIKGKNLARFYIDNEEIVEVNRILEEYPVSVILSFVENAGDILWAKRTFAGAACIVPKIETLAAVENFKEILRQAEIVLIGRGDLSLSAGIEKIGVIQKNLIYKAHKKRRRVAVGTGTLVSLLRSETPVSAEIIDITNSCAEGVDVILLTTETAGSAEPFKAINFLTKTLEYIKGV